MHDQYVEVLVKRAPVKGADTLKAVVGGLTFVFLLLASMLGNLLFFVLAVIAGLIYYFKILRLNVEFEYFYMDGEFEIAQIFNKSKRKKFLTLNENMIELIAPMEAEEVSYYSNAKVIDCSANDPQRPPYAMICNYNNALNKVLLQMNDELLKALKRQMPGKVRMH